MKTNEIKLHKWQNRAWESKKRFIFFCAGVQSGKTTFGCIWIVNESEECGAGDYLIIAPTYKILQQSTMQKFQEIIPNGWGTFNKAESVFRARNGRTFFLRSADKPESIEGITARAIWADEASLMKPDIWLMMQGRVSGTQGRILCTFTPIALNWVHKEIEKDKERRNRGEEGDIDFIQFPSVESPYFPKEEYERAKRMLTPIQFQLRYEGIFGKAEGLIYADFDEKYNVCDDFPIPEDWTKIGGIDWGFINPFVALKLALSPDDILYVYKEYYQSKQTLKEHSRNMSPDIPYYADPSGAQEIQEMQALGYDVIPANNDVDMGILTVNARLRKQDDSERTVRLKVFRSCVNVIDELSLYQYDRNQSTGEWKEKPMKRDDHCMDALRYAIIELDRGGIGDLIVAG